MFTLALAAGTLLTWSLPLHSASGALKELVLNWGNMTTGSLCTHAHRVVVDVRKAARAQTNTHSVCQFHHTRYHNMQDTSHEDLARDCLKLIVGVRVRSYACPNHTPHTPAHAGLACGCGCSSEAGHTA